MLAHKPAPLAKGFTLIELLVTIALVGILAALAAPSFRDFLVRRQLESITSEFTTDLARARSEAINRNICTTMCMSSTTGNSAPQCAGSGQDWQLGWIVFVNPSCSTTQNRPTASDVIVARAPKTGDYYLNAQTSGLRKIMFNARGSPSLAAAAEFDAVYVSVNNPLTLSYAKNVCLDALGRTRTVPSASNCLNYK